MNIFEDFFHFKRYNLHQIASAREETKLEDKAADSVVGNAKDGVDDNTS